MNSIELSWEHIKIHSQIFFVAHKIFRKHSSDGTSSLLENLTVEKIKFSEMFWKEFYKFSIKENSEKHQKKSTFTIIEKILFYHFSISHNLEESKNFI